MKFNGPEDSPSRKFEDEVTKLIDDASDDLTVAEMIGVLEIQMFVLKHRMLIPKLHLDDIV